MHFRYLNHRALRQLAYTNLVSFPFLNFAKFSSWHIASYYQQTGTIVRVSDISDASSCFLHLH